LRYAISGFVGVVSCIYGYKLNVKNLLCICIPTFNRAHRLKKTLNDLYDEISTSKNKGSISVYVSNNGSTDDTVVIIEEACKTFQRRGIAISYDSFSNNQGFDRNVMRCYEKCNSDYLWFFSDDDNLIPGAADVIVNDIATINPSIILYNFNQSPHGYSNPWIQERVFYESIETGDVISKIIKWPKLSAIVIKKYNGGAGLVVSQMEGANYSGFMHVALVLQTLFECGRLLLSKVFIAYPDADYMDHVDFPPYIWNSLEDLLHKLIAYNKKSYLNIASPNGHVNRLNSSLEELSSFYMGKRRMLPSLKKELISTVIYEMWHFAFLKSGKIGFLRAVKKFIFAYVGNRTRK
jgi:glycosyltransferase involved in cell wall biosynthesis